MLVEKTKKIELTGQYYIFNFINSLGSFFIESYFLILLYKTTGDFVHLAVEKLLWALGTYIGYVVGSFIIQRFGYVGTFKAAFLLFLISSVITFLFLDEIVVFYPFFSLTRGLATGSFWSVMNLYSLREFNMKSRNSVINVYSTISNILNIVMPVLVGGLLTFFGNYKLIYLLAVGIYIIGVVFPIKYNKHPKGNISGTEITTILRSPAFLKFAFLTITAASRNILIEIVLLIIPFLFIGNEFGVGVFASLVNFFAAMMFYVNRHTKISKEVKRGYFGITIYTLITSALAYIWTLPMLVIRSLTYTLISPFIDPIMQNMDFKIRTDILGKQLNESSVEMNLVVETLLLIGRVLAVGSLTIAIAYFPNNIMDILRIATFVSAVWAMGVYFIQVKLSKADKNHQ